MSKIANFIGKKVSELSEKEKEELFLIMKKSADIVFQKYITKDSAIAVVISIDHKINITTDLKRYPSWILSEENFLKEARKLNNVNNDDKYEHDNYFDELNDEVDEFILELLNSHALEISGFSNLITKILWVSLTEMTNEYYVDLERIYGNISIIPFKNTVTSWEDIYNAGKDCDVIAINTTHPAIISDLVLNTVKQQVIQPLLQMRDTWSSEWKFKIEHDSKKLDELPICQSSYWEQIKKIEMNTIIL